jgi:hypothetical protein
MAVLAPLLHCMHACRRWRRSRWPSRRGWSRSRSTTGSSTSGSGTGSRRRRCSSRSWTGSTRRRRAPPRSTSTPASWEQQRRRCSLPGRITRLMTPGIIEPSTVCTSVCLQPTWQGLALAYKYEDCTTLELKKQRTPALALACRFAAFWSFGHCLCLVSWFLDEARTKTTIWR